jgi:hypothetical protein
MGISFSTTFLQGSVVGYYTNVSAEVRFISGFVMIKGIERVSGEGEGQSLKALPGREIYR